MSWSALAVWAKSSATSVASCFTATRSISPPSYSRSVSYILLQAQHTALSNHPKSASQSPLSSTAQQSTSSSPNCPSTLPSPLQPPHPLTNPPQYPNNRRNHIPPQTPPHLQALYPRRHREPDSPSDGRRAISLIHDPDERKQRRRNLQSRPDPPSHHPSHLPAPLRRLPRHVPSTPHCSAGPACLQARVFYAPGGSVHPCPVRVSRSRMGILVRSSATRLCLFGLRACKIYFPSVFLLTFPKPFVLTSRSRTMCFAVAFMNMGHPGPAFEGDRQRLRDIDAAARRNSAPRRWFSGLRSQQPSRV